MKHPINPVKMKMQLRLCLSLSLLQRSNVSPKTFQGLDHRSQIALVRVFEETVLHSPTNIHTHNVPTSRT